MQTTFAYCSERRTSFFSVVAEEGRVKVSLLV